MSVAPPPTPPETAGLPAPEPAFAELPALTSPWDVTRICVAAFIICVLAGLAPAWNAARLRPVDALRHE